MFPQAELIKSAVKMAYASRLTIYDALYLTLAKTLGAPLLSLDSRLAEAAEKVGVRVLRG
jgi:predicted nucleic acid-binding protein